MPSLRSLFILPLLVVASLVSAQESLTVDRVDFNTTRDDWTQMEIKLTCLGNPSPEARDNNYLEGVKLKVYLAYERDAAAAQYDYYMSEVEIVIMERGDSYNVYFYLPGLIVERDKLRAEPEFYYVEVTIGETTLTPLKNSMSSSIKNLQILESMKSKANAEGEANAGLLMPIYYAPAEVRGRTDDLPLLLRRDPKQ